MVYTSLEFFALFLVTWILFVSTSSRQIRYLILTAASLFFYAWAGIFDCCIFMFVVAASYLAAYIANRNTTHRGHWIALGISVLVAHLAFWKYFPWVAEGWGYRIDLPLPVGISFFTFQGIAFLVDLGRGDAPMMSFREYLLFKSFFSQLIAGPIVRARQMVPQLRTLKRPTTEDMVQGISLFTMGLFKKLIIADHLSLFVFNVFNAPEKYNRSTLIWGVLSFTAQDWADFSGYTDMGRGTARMLGIRLPENFLAPALARTPIELWKRWHITLAQWMRDYVFFPLIKSIPIRDRLTRTVLAILITFLLVGLWHGPSWTYVVWGLYIGILFLLELLISRSFLAQAWEMGIPYAIRTWILVPLTLCSSMLGLTLYRSMSFGNFFLYLTSLWSGGNKVSLMNSAFPIYRGVVLTALFQFVFFYSFKKKNWPTLEFVKFCSARVKSSPARTVLAVVAGALVGLALVVSIAYRQYETFSSFIYFQF